MRRSINFGSIFRRKEGLQPTDSKEQTGFPLERFAERAITLKEGDLVPLTNETFPLNWATVGGRITVPASAIEGLLEGRARIRAQQLKSLSPSPIGCETQDSIEYEVSLATVVPQILDLMGHSEPEAIGQPEFETPFTVLAREDSARFAHKNHKKQRQEAHEQSAAAQDTSSPSGIEPPLQIATGKQESETPPERPALSLTALRTLSRAPANQPALPPEPPAGQQFATKKPGPEKAEPEAPLAAIPEAPGSGECEKKASRLQVDGPPRLVEEDLARQGVERLQEIFMTSKPLDGRRVASLVQELPGVNGALIVLEGGVVLGGQLPAWFSLEAALQAPEILKNFTRFISEIEVGRKAESKFVSVTSATTISLVASGQIVILVSHQSRKLPPGLAQRLTETAEALNLIYGNS